MVRTQRAVIDTQMHLAPLVPVLGTVLLAFPLAFTQELDAIDCKQLF